MTIAPPRPVPAPAPRALATRPARPPRDHAVDGVRAIGTVLVVLLHWLMVEAAWDGETLTVGNALAHGPAWVLTWLNPLPLLFLAAGAAAGYDLARRPESGPALVRRRLRALVRPVATLVGLWAIALVVLPAAGVPRAAVVTAATIVVQPLWFLAVYLVLTAFAPALVRRIAAASARAGLPGALAVVGAVAGAALACDAARWATGDVALGWPTLVVGWAVPFALGAVHAHERGQGRELPRRLDAVLLAGGLLATVALVVLGPYPVSLIGMPGDAVSNLGPPTAPVITFAVAQTGAFLLLHRRITAAWTASPALRWVGARSMPLYLWHLTAAFVVAGIVMLGLGQPLAEPWTPAWWVTLPLFLGAAALVLAGLTALAARTQPTTAQPTTAQPSTAAATSTTGTDRIVVTSTASRASMTPRS